MTEWTARIEWSTPDPYDLDSLDMLVTKLGSWHAAIGREAVPAGADEKWSATLTVEESTLRKAIAAALKIVEDATGWGAEAIEVLDADVHEHRVMQPSIPELWGYGEIADHFGVSKQRAAQLAGRPGFPVAVVETKAGPLRIRSQVEGWGKTWDRKTGRPRKTAAAS